MSKRARILIVVGVAAGIGVVYAWFFGFATLFAAEARYVAWKTPTVKIAPVELTDLSVSAAPGPKLSYFGYEFEVPWADVDYPRTKVIGKMQLIAFRSGRSILFSSMVPREFVDSFVSSNSGNSQQMRLLFGEDALQSDYSLQRLIWDATPNQVTLTCERKDAVRTSMLLIYKSVMLPRGGESGIFRVRTRTLQGFQFGSPIARPKSVDIELFSEEGGVAFVFVQKEKDGPTISQAEINRTIQSVRRVGSNSLGPRGRS